MIGRTSIRSKGVAFTIIEVMIAISIFMMVMAAVYATWIAVIRASQASLKAAANAQRSRIAIRTLQDALLTAVNHLVSLRYYSFTAEAGGEYADIQFSARLPDSFPGVGRFGGSIVRRVRFVVEDGEDGKKQLVLYQQPLLLPDEVGEFSPYRLILSRDVSRFEVKFYDAQAREFTSEWKQTNSLPKLMHLTLGLGRREGSDAPMDLTSTFIAIPANPVAPELQTPFRGGVP